MGDTKMTKYERKLRRKDWANRVLSVVLSFAMVISSTPLPAGAVGEDDAAAAAQPTAAEVQAQQEQAATEASVSLNLSHAYLTVSGQTVGDVTKSLTVPTTKDLAFTVAADSGYEVSEVYTSKDGTKTSLGTAAGNYTIPAASLADGLAVCVTTTELPQATQEETTATPLAKEESSDKAAEADAAKTSDAAEAESEAEATADQPATDQPAEEATPTKTTYTYEDDQVSVTATLQDPAAVPDDAQFKVTPVTQGSTDYNYDAYMDALNQSAADDADKTYTSDNTLLYDVAFMVPKTDEAGNAIAGEWVEYEPTAGSVDIQISFKQSQLTDGIDAQSSDDVEVKHLPLTDAVRDATDSTADATNISASDVQVEDVLKADVTTDGQQAVSITTDSLSVMALAVHRAAANVSFHAVGGQLTYDQILGNARYFGIVANKWYQAEAETNAAVKTLYTNGSQSGNDLTAGNDHQPWFIGQMGSYGISWESNKENLTEHVPPADGKTLQIKGRNSDVYTPSDNFPYLWSNETINFHNATQDAVNSYVGSMLTDMNGKSTTYAGRSSLSGSLPTPVTDQSDPNHMTTNYVLDFTTSGAGTYYVDVTSIYDQLNDSGLKIKANSNQTIVLNVTKTDAVTLKKFTMTIDGKEVDSASTNAGGEAVATHLVWNIPNATTVNIDGSILGMVIAPNAMVRVNDTSAGWVIANAVRSGAGEWHNVWQSYDQNYTKISTTAQVTKVLEGGTLKAGQFTFVLADSQDNQVATATNDASGNVTFADITYDQPGTYTYKIYEQIPDDATNASGVSYANATDDQKSAGGFAKESITYDSTVHTMVVKVEHRAGSSDAIRGALIATTTFDNGTATGVTFTNSKAQSTTARVQVQKELSTGATPAAGAYEFQLIDAAGTVVQTKTNDGEGLVSFDPITYTAAGTYTYTIHESSTAKQGWTNASDKTATVTVSSKNGGLVASVAYSDGSNVMTNTAAAGFSVWGSKALLGGALEAGQYTFDLKDADGNLVATTTNGTENGVGSFVLSSPSDYIRTAGTWDFTVTERIPDDATNAAGTRWDQASAVERAAGGFTKGGVVYDSSTKGTIRVTSSFDANGALTVNAYVASGSVAFTNKKTTGFTVVGTKTLEGASLAEGAYTFQLKDASGALVATATNGADGSFTLASPATAITGPGLYAYTVSELVPNDATNEAGTRWDQASDAERTAGGFKKAGVTYDSHVETVYIRAEYKNGTIVAYKANADGTANSDVVTFANTYEATGRLVLSGTKELRAADGTAAALAQGQFTFQLKEGDATLETVGNAADGTVAFSPLIYSTGATDAAHRPGEHTYTISEVQGTDPNVTYSTQTHTIKVMVTDNHDGTLSVTKEEGSDDFAGWAFSNTKASSASVQLQASKTINGKTPDGSFDGKFSFDLKDANGTVLQTKQNSAGGAVAFDAMTYDSVGTYTYTINEVVPDDDYKLAGVTYDTTTVHVSVEVTNQGGKLVATPTYAYGEGTGATQGSTFKNTYDASGSVQLTAKKVLNNKALADQAFTFQLKDASGKVLQEKKNDASGTVTFDALDYGLADVGTTLAYTISEAIPADATNSQGQTYAGAADKSGSWTKDGITYDGGSKTVTVTVADNHDGTLAVTATGDGEAATFTNTYAAVGTFNLGGSKHLDGRSFRQGDEWTFTVTGSEEAPMPAENSATIDPTAGTDQAFSFGDISYSLANAGHTYTYTITESGSGAGVTNDSKTHTVEVAVADKGDGTLSVTPTYKVDGATTDGLTFTNTYTAQKTGITIKGTKTLEGRDIADGEFQVALYAANDQFEITNQEPVATANVAAATASNGVAAGSYALSVNTYVREGTYRYVLKEVDTGKPGVAYDTTAYQVTVEVTDDHEGHLQATVSGVDKDAANFKNTFTAASAVLKAHKTLTGGTLAADQFTFELRDSNNKVIDTEKNNASGDVQFKALTYSEPGDYTYTINEQIPADATKKADGTYTKDGVTYDGTSHPVTVHVDNSMNVTYKYDLVTTFLPASEAPVAQFTNTYTVKAVGFSVSGTKRLTGANLTANQFTFTLKDNVGNTVGSAQNDAYGNFTITTAGDLIKRAGTYTYTLSENDAASGITNDTNASRTVTVRVSDDKHGNLVVDPVEVAGGTTFTNKYAATGSAHFEATKELTGADLKAGQFTFTLTGADDGVSQTATNGVGDDASKVQFADVTYTMESLRNADGTYAQSKDFHYTIAEVNDHQGGVTYDGSTQTVVVHVTNNGDGTLGVSYDNGANTSKVFTNTYTATGTASLSARKELTGRTLRDGEFTFALTAGTNANNDTGVATPMPEGTANGVKTATNDADGLASFGNISYAKEGAYHYTITEVAGDEADMAYDPSSYDVTVNVADKGDGTMAVTYGANKQAIFTSPVFKNTHNARGSATITAKKSLAGRALAAGEFSFQLRDAKGNLLQTATNAADGTVAFQPVSYQLADLENADGTYAESKDFTYTISEVDNGLPGVTYDSSVKTVTVHATLNKATGTIDTSVSGGGADATFSNTYTAQSAGFTVTGTKDLAGREIKDGEFSVALYATDAQGNLTGDAIATAPVAANGTYTLTTADNLLTAAGTYTYKVVEVRGSDTNITYDSTAKDVTVQVTDNTQTGKLEAVANEGATLPAFTNTYSAQGSIFLKAHKVLTGRNLAAGQFTFQVTGSEGAPLPAGAVDGVATATNDAQGDVTFAGITFSQADAGKTYTYTISEVNGGKAGYTYDAQAKQVVVNVADNGDGSLHITYGASKVEDMPVAQFANTYQATGSTTVSGHKTVNGADRTDLDGKVTFTLTGADGTSLTAKTDANGNFSFGDIAYDQDDAGKTYTYTLKETEAPNGYTKAADQTFTVSVTDNGDGTLTATKSTGDAVFTVNDQYAATGSAHFEAAKQLSGAELKAGQFSFTLSEGGKVLQTVQNGADGKVTFADLAYTLADVGTHTYTIAEAIPDGATRNADGTYILSGVTYDGSTQTVKVTVSDNGDGTLGVSYEGDANTSKVFKNSYKATGQAQLSATKQLEGRTLADGEFSFQLKDAQGNVLQTKQNAENGTVTFDPISYDKAGTYHYTITEVAGDEADMTYDPSVKEVTVNVADKGDSTMAVTYGADKSAVFQAPTFGNTHNAKGSATITAAKTLTGRAQEAGEFSFQLRDAAGNLLQTATNAADGTVAFEPIAYQLSDLGGAESKDFEYTISEVQGNKPGVAYDTDVKTVTVHATLNKATGTIDTTVEGDGTSATFANTYTASGKATLSATKTLNGAAPALGQFAFNLYGPDGELLQTVHNGANGTVSFADIPYTQADAGKTYTYTLAEAIPEGATKNDDGTYTLDGFTYDGHAEQVTVNVADKGDGTLAVTYGSDPATATTQAPVATFANTYTAAATGFTVEGTKTLNYQAPAAGAYSFQLADADGIVVGTASNDADGHFSIATADDLISAAGTYTYTLSEVVPEGATDNGDGTYTDAATDVTYDGHTATVTVTVADNGKGQLVPTVTTDQGATDFANSQKASVTLTATKALTGNQALAGDDYAFELLRADGTQLTSARNAADGTVTFPAIFYSIDDLKQDDGSYADSKTFTYTMREVVPGSATNAEGVLYADATDEQKAAGGFRTTSVSADGQPTYVTYDTTEHPVTVTLTCKDGVLTATTDEGYQAPTFTNYAFAASTSLTFDKHYYGSGSPTFSFTLQAADANWEPRAGSAIEADANAILLDDGENALAATVQNGAFTDGVATVSLPTIQYAKPGTYHYLLTEDGASDEASDATQFLITVTVAQDGTSSATYQARYGDEGDVQATDSLAFYNNAMVSMGYRALALAASRPSTSGVTVQPLVKKTLDGNSSLEADAFSFTITDNQTGQVLETVGNASDGQVAFGKLRFTKDMLDGAAERTFTYTISEADTGDASIVYDRSTVTMAVTVSLKNDRLTVSTPTYTKTDDSGTVTYTGTDTPVFENRTKTVKVRTRKVSKDDNGNPTDEGLVDGVYGLWMVGSNGSQDVYMGHQTSDANGYMVFDVPITEGAVYYFQEEHAPAGHLVDPYPSRKFTLTKDESGKYKVQYLEN